MAFTDTIRSIPFTPNSVHARGFVPPIIRAMGHILFLTGSLADENVTVAATEAEAELQAAEDHWNARATTPAISEAIATRASTIGTAIHEARSEFASWTEANRLQNIRDLAHRIVGFCADLDRELVGLTDSDPGSSL